MTKLWRGVLMMCALLLATPAWSADNDYRMGTGDVLRITVYGQPDLTTEARVGDSGNISFPLIGDVKMAALMGLAAGFPAMTVGLFFTAIYTRLTRASMLEVGSLDFVKTARAKGVIEKVVAMANWSGHKALPKGRGLGFAFYYSHMGYFAEVLDVEVADGVPKVKTVWVAGDVGSQIINQINALHQVQGSVIEGLGQALAGQAITQVAGAVEQGNFDTPPLQRIPDTPAIIVEFVKTDYPPTGLGEPALPPVIPALVNAIHAATGKRIRSLPVTAEMLA